MNKRQQVALLYGGRSGEHEVSLRSAYSVFTHLDSQKFEPVLIGITLAGRWYLQSTDVRRDNATLAIIEDPSLTVSAVPGDGLYCGSRKLEVDFVFPVLHGTFGEDGTMQGLLELVGLPYAGAGVLGSSLAMDKGTAKEIWTARGLPVVPFTRFELDDFHADTAMYRQKLAQMRQKFGLPLFVKPLRAGSSVGVTRVDSFEDLAPAFEEAFRFDTALMVEPAIDGREVECSVIGNRDPVSFPPGEILPSHDFYDYEAKYIDPDGAVLRLPAEIPDSVADELQSIAIEAYKAAAVEGMARVDFFVENSSGRVLLNEINTIPGFTSISMFPRMCEAGGLMYADLLSRMIVLGFQRFEERSRCTYSLLTKTEAEG